MTPLEALAVLHGIVEQTALSGKDRDVARKATEVLKGLIDKPVDMGGAVPEQVKA